MWYNVKVVERYRSGHNGADSKSVCAKAHEGSNPSLSAINNKGWLKPPFVIYLGERGSLKLSLQSASFGKGSESLSLRHKNNEWLLPLVVFISGRLVSRNRSPKPQALVKVPKPSLSARGLKKVRIPSSLKNAANLDKRIAVFIIL